MPNRIVPKVGDIFIGSGDKLEWLVLAEDNYNNTGYVINSKGKPHWGRSFWDGEVEKGNGYYLKQRATEETIGWVKEVLSTTGGW